MKHLTFGVEFEFCVACVVDPQKPDPDPGEEGKVFFEHTEDLRHEFFREHNGENAEPETEEDSRKGAEDEDEEEGKKNDERLPSARPSNSLSGRNEAVTTPRRRITEKDRKRGSGDTIFNLFMAEFGI